MTIPSTTGLSVLGTVIVRGRDQTEIVFAFRARIGLWRLIGIGRWILMGDVTGVDAVLRKPRITPDCIDP